MSGISLLPNRRSLVVSVAAACAASLFFPELGAGYTPSAQPLQAAPEFLRVSVDRPATVPADIAKTLRLGGPVAIRALSGELDQAKSDNAITRRRTHDSQS